MLDGPRGKFWAVAGCAQTNTQPCPGILAGWFMWALREAAAKAGHDGSASEAQEYFGRLAREVNGACDTGQLECGPPLSGLAPRFRWEYAAPTMRAALRLAGMVLDVAPDQIGSLPSRGPAYQIAVFADMAGPVYPELSERMVLSGWLAEAGAVPRLSVAGPAGEAVSTALATAPAPDVAERFPGLEASRFELQASCIAGCSLVLAGADGEETVIPFDALRGTPGVGPKLSIDGAGIHDPGSAGAALRAVRVRIATVVSAMYGLAVPPALVLALLGLTATLARRRFVQWPLVAFMAACAVATASRVLLLAYLDATSIPSVSNLYASPVSPLVISFAVVGIWLGWSSMRQFAAGTAATRAELP